MFGELDKLRSQDRMVGGCGAGAYPDGYYTNQFLFCIISRQATPYLIVFLLRSINYNPLQNIPFEWSVICLTPARLG